eukprot:6161064-Amphidinium_carterae.1
MTLRSDHGVLYTLVEASSAMTNVLLLLEVLNISSLTFLNCVCGNYSTCLSFWREYKPEPTPAHPPRAECRRLKMLNCLSILISRAERTFLEKSSDVQPTVLSHSEASSQ